MKQKRRLVGAILIACMVAVGGCYVCMPLLVRDGTQPADLVVLNARIFTSDQSRPWAEALAVKDERISYVGDDDGAEDYIGPNTRVIFARNRMIVPGFVDNHCHALWMGGMRALMADLYAANSIEEVKTEMNRYAAEHPNDPFLIGLGWRYEYISGGMPDKAMADTILVDRPMLLWSNCGNTGWLNTKALEMFQERNPTAFHHLDPQTNEAGDLTGLLMHFHAFNMFDFFSAEELGEEIMQRFFDQITAAIEYALSFGVTTIHDIQIYKTFIPMLLDYRDRGGLDRIRARLAYYVGSHSLEDEEGLKTDLAYWKTLTTESDDHLILGEAVKLYIEGVPLSHTALMLEPYTDQPDNYGDATWTQEDFDHVIEMVDGMGFQACTHSTGDGGARRVINSYEYAQQQNGPRDARHRIEHCELIKPDDIERMVDLDIYAAMQPTHFFGDGMFEEVFGMERLQRLMPWRSLQEAGVNISFGSDWMAGPINPIYGLLISSTRLNYQGNTDWGPDEAVDLEDALRFWTIESAKGLFMENKVGSITVGKFGDFAMFSIDLLKIDSPWFLLTHDIELGALDDFVDMTVVGGKIVYHKPGTKF